MSQDDIIIDVKNVWKRYGLPPILPWKKSPEREEDYALKDISFQVRRGGSLGILGRNGAGKSTLLKLLAGVTPPDKGSIEIRGKIFSMIELSAGISMDLTGRENIRLLATVMGFSQEEIYDIEPKVIEFSELDTWIDRPVWQYSSGMLARLAFGIAVNAKADILLVDEVLSTGDIMFQKKCQQHVQKLLSGGVTLIFVSHSPYQVEKLCETGLLLECGRCTAYSSSSIIMRKYMRQSLRQNTSQALNGNTKNDLSSTAEERPGTGDLRVTSFSLINATGQSVTEITTGEDITFVIEYVAKEDIFPVNVNIIVYSLAGAPLCLFIPPHEDGEFIAIKKGKGSLSCFVPSFSLIGEGLYCNTRFNCIYVLDSVENALTFSSIPDTKIADRSHVGAIFLESRWEQKY